MQASYADHPSGALDPATQAVFAAHVHEHPLVNHYRATGSGEPVMISDFLQPRPNYTPSAFFAEFFHGISVEHQIAISLPGPDQQVIGVALSRGYRDFSDQDRALLGVLRARSSPRCSAPAAVKAGQALGAAGLTDREIAILRLVAAGCTNSAIAHQIGLSPRTVAKHLEHVYRKLGVSSRAAAVSRLRAAGRPDRDRAEH